MTSRLGTGKRLTLFYRVYTAAHNWNPQLIGGKKYTVQIFGILGRPSVDLYIFDFCELIHIVLTVKRKISIKFLLNNGGIFLIYSTVYGLFV